jgi:hypothetical protein
MESSLTPLVGAAKAKRVALGFVALRNQVELPAAKMDAI